MPRVLLLSSALPHPPTAGDRQRTALVYDALRAHAEVGLVALRPLEPGLRGELERRFGLVDVMPLPGRGAVGPWRWLRGGWPKLVDRVAHNVGSTAGSYAAHPGAQRRLAELVKRGEYDVIVGRYLLPTARCGALGVGVPVVLDIDDLDTSIYRSMLARPGQGGLRRAALRWHLRGLEKVVPRRLAAASALWIASASDRPLVDHPRVFTFPNIPFAEADAPAPAVSPSTGSAVLFLGSMGNRSNREGVSHFLAHIWPAVLARCPGARFRIAGSGMADALRTAWSAAPGVDVLGLVDDVASTYADAALTVAPLYHGGGTKIKVVESLRHGRAIVATPHAARGYERLDDGGHGLVVADTDAAFADAVVAMLADEAARNTAAQRGAAAVDAGYSRRRLAEVVGETLAALR